MVIMAVIRSSSHPFFGWSRFGADPAPPYFLYIFWMLRSASKKNAVSGSADPHHWQNVSCFFHVKHWLCLPPWSLVYPLCCRSLNTNSQFSIISSSPLFAAGLRTPDLMPRSVRLASADDRCLSLLPPPPPSRARVSAQQSRGRAPPPPRLTSPYLSPDFGLSSPAKKKEKMQHKS